MACASKTFKNIVFITDRHQPKNFIRLCTYDLNSAFTRFQGFAITSMEKSIVKYDVELDLCGLQCPLPILRSKKALAKLAESQVIHVMATDAGSLKDFPVFCQVTGHELLDSWKKESCFHFVIKKRPD